MKLTKAAIATACLLGLSLPVSAAPLALPEQGIVLEGQAKYDYVADTMHALFAAKKSPKPFELPDNWKRTETALDNITLEQYTNTKAADGKVLLQLHGGGYIFGMSDGHRMLAMKQAVMSGAREAYCVNYRLAPDHVYPAALEDAVAAYEYIVEKGTNPKDIILTGDSAGGNLVIELALYLRDNGMELPCALLLQSPWTDFTTAPASREYNASRDQILGIGTPLNQPVKDAVYAGSLAKEDPRLSPVHADLRGLPPMLIQTGGREIFLTENQKFAAKAAADEVEVTMTVYPGMSHDFPVCLPDIDEAVKALQEIRAFVERHK